MGGDVGGVAAGGVDFELVGNVAGDFVGDVADVFDVAYVTYVLRWLGYIGHIRYIRNISYIKNIGLRAVSSLGASVGSATWLRGCLLRQGIVLRASAALGRAWHPFGR